MAFITVAGQELIAQKQGDAEVLNINKFVLANIAGLGDEPTDRIENIPDSGDIVWQGDVSHFGYVNANQVVYSLTLDSTIGDFEFNWVGLVSAENTLIAVTYIPLTQKRATAGAVPGNNLTRNFLIAYSGIAEITAIDVPAETWQIDFTTRLLQIDERERLSNFDIYGHESFFGDGWQVVRDGTTANYNVLAGIGYVGGIRAESAEDQVSVLSSPPGAIWLDVSLQGDINGVDAVMNLIADNADHPDYTDSNGFHHYVTKIADIASDGSVTDTRTFADNLAGHLADADPHPQYTTDAEVDALITARLNKLDYKESVRFTTVGDIALAGLGTQTGGDWPSALTAGDRILVKNQTTAANNGIYIAASGSWTRSGDADANAEVTAGMMVVVTEGATLADTEWELATNDAITLGVTSLTFVRIGPSDATQSVKGITRFATGSETADGLLDDVAVTPEGLMDALRALSPVVQQLVLTRSDLITIGTIIPMDNTIPQRTEGTEIFAQAFTPKFADSYIDFILLLQGCTTVSGAARMAAAVFSSLSLDALAATTHANNSSVYLTTMQLMHTELAGSTAARIYSIRVGRDTSTMYINSGTPSGSGQVFGGKIKSSLMIVERRPSA